MNYNLSARASTRQGVTDSMQSQFEALGEACEPHTIDFSAPMAALGVALGAIPESETLDIVATMSGAIAFVGDTHHQVQFSINAMLVDR